MHDYLQALLITVARCRIPQLVRCISLFSARGQETALYSTSWKKRYNNPSTVGDVLGSNSEFKFRIPAIAPYWLKFIALPVN